MMYFYESKVFIYLNYTLFQLKIFLISCRLDNYLQKEHTI